MSKYTPEQKAEALRILDETGSAFAASHQSGVSERTLFRWQRERTLTPPPQEKTQLTPPPPTLSFPDDPEFEEALREEAAAADHIIDDVLDELLKDVQVLSKRIRHNFDQAPPVSQIMALTRLLDRVIKLDARKPRLERRKSDFAIIRYQDPDGSIHKTPPWERRNRDTSVWSHTRWRDRAPRPDSETED
jgi:hypothetical protein